MISVCGIRGTATAWRRDESESLASLINTSAVANRRTHTHTLQVGGGGARVRVVTADARFRASILICLFLKHQSPFRNPEHQQHVTICSLKISLKSFCTIVSYFAKRQKRNGCRITSSLSGGNNEVIIHSVFVILPCIL